MIYASVNGFEIFAFVLYFLFVLGIGFYFFFKSKANSEKDYFLGGKSMNGWVSALSAGASDMSAWVLMGLPGAIFLNGLGQVWISIGLFIGTVCAWIFLAPKLRRYAVLADDAVTLPQFLSARFKSPNNVLRIACAIIFLVGYTLYSASSIVACGDLFNTLTGIKVWVGMIIATIIILVYTFLGGFKAVSWTDFFQGMLMLAALMLVPIIMAIVLKVKGPAAGSIIATSPNYYNLLSSGKFNWASISDIITGLGWGLGYFGMPHILVRYMAIKDEKEMKKSRIIGSTWTFLILTMATVLALIAHEFLGSNLLMNENGDIMKNLVFVTVVRTILGVGGLALIAGILISAIVAASMSTADSQLLAASSAFSSDIYKTKINPNATDKQVLNVGRITVAAIAVLALGIALITHFAKLGSIMELVSAAWSIFGAAFGPVMILALFWKRLNYKGAVAAIITGFATSILWILFFNAGYYGFKAVIYNTNVYEIVPGFILGMVVAVIVSLTTEEPSDEVKELFDKVKDFRGTSADLIDSSTAQDEAE